MPTNPWSPRRLGYGPKISIGMYVDTTSLRKQMNLLGEGTKDVQKLNKAAAKMVKDERSRRVPKVSRHFEKAAFMRATVKEAYVGLKGTGGRYGRDYVGVVEFGGTIPVPHSRTNPRLAGHRRLANPRKPWIGGKFGTSYYLYPALEDKRMEIASVYQTGFKALCDKYMP